MNRRLAAAVAATFRECGQADLYSRLAIFSDRDWRLSLHWLDASGLALYFLRRLKTLGLEEILPPDVLSELESRLADNKERSASLFDEAQGINRAFQAAGLNYVNLKGFTLVPDYCPDSSLRCQFDLDFLVAANEIRRAGDILKTFGYELTGHGDNVLEFKSGSTRLPSIRDLYKSRPGRSVEVHYTTTSSTSGFSPNLLSRSRNIGREARAFPALSEADTFLTQARHLLKHVRSEWTRLSWLLEYKTFVSSRHDDSTFWQILRAQAQASPDDALAIGVALWLATEAFGSFVPPTVLTWSVDTLPAAVQMWLEHCGQTVLFSDFPGTKLYLLLNRALSPQDAGIVRDATRKLFPTHMPPRVIASGKGLKQQGRTLVAQAKYILFRLRFHLSTTWQYAVVARQWNKVATTRQREPGPLLPSVVEISSAALDR